MIQKYYDREATHSGGGVHTECTECGTKLLSSDEEADGRCNYCSEVAPSTPISHTQGGDGFLEWLDGEIDYNERMEQLAGAHGAVFRGRAGILKEAKTKYFSPAPTDKALVEEVVEMSPEKRAEFLAVIEGIPVSRATAIADYIDQELSSLRSQLSKMTAEKAAIKTAFEQQYIELQKLRNNP